MKKYEEEIEVELAPGSFAWRGRRYQVERVIKRWRESPVALGLSRIADLEVFRVEAEGGVYDIRCDRPPIADGRWRLRAVWD